ncbi:hypothetical protein [Microbacterium radiodurans]|uniref:DUF3558 domain-containing protein n=1 Tax=Microbacterium radiodurans TaxID=661398 RepID=A0A5J5IU13_9MICO|nr:hypothetical protein [Microbacterium radiodurans]KAA9089398.1 hypothetical protein F6B42_02620 [Microbacterium radiodurans]
MRRQATLRSSVIAAAGMLVLAGCAPPAAEAPAASGSSTAIAPAPDATPDVTTPSSTPTSASNGIATGFAVPACEQQVDEAAVQSAFGSDVSFIADVTETWEPVGPAAQEALAGATAAVACLWGVPNSGRGVSIAVADLGDPAADLIAALRDSDAYVESDAEGALLFAADAIETGDVTSSVAYVFDGVAWVSVSGGELADATSAREVALAVHAALRAG